MKYDSYQRNHVILPGRGDALQRFLEQDYQGMRHKMRNAFSSNSEDALTWSCFDILANHPDVDRAAALDELMEDAFQGASPLSFTQRGIESASIAIHIGRTYTGQTTGESTEVDVSIDAPGVLVFVEAKLYSSVSPASPPQKPHDQIARKLRVGLDSVVSDAREFYFVFLDIAPIDMLFENRAKAEVAASTNGDYKEKWRSAWLFKYYKQGRNGSLRPLSEALAGVSAPAVETVARNMGWLTWADVFKCSLRAAVCGSH